MTTSDTTTETSNQNPGEGAGTSDTTSSTTPPQGTGATAPPASEGTGSDGGATGEDGKGTKGDAGDGKPEGGQPAGAPEQYEAFTLPEGFKLEGERLGQAQEFFKAQDWTQEQAQAAVDLYSRLAGEDVVSIQQALNDQRQQQVEQWGADLKAQLGDQYAETIGLARTAVQAIGDPAVIEAFNEQGWGNHPAMAKAFAFFGKFLRDSQVDGLGGGTSGTRSGDLATRLFGDPK